MCCAFVMTTVPFTVTFSNVRTCFIVFVLFLFMLFVDCGQSRCYWPRGPVWWPVCTRTVLRWPLLSNWPKCHTGCPVSLNIFQKTVWELLWHYGIMVLWHYATTVCRSNVCESCYNFQGNVWRQHCTFCIATRSVIPSYKPFTLTYV